MCCAYREAQLSVDFVGQVWSGSASCPRNEMERFLSLPDGLWPGILTEKYILLIIIVSKRPGLIRGTGEFLPQIFPTPKKLTFNKVFSVPNNSFGRRQRAHHHKTTATTSTTNATANVYDVHVYVISECVCECECICVLCARVCQRCEHNNAARETGVVELEQLL